MQNNSEIKKKLLTLCNDEIREYFSLIRHLSLELGVRVFLVGGAVRDLLLDFESFDFDFLVQGKAEVFVEKLQEYSERFQKKYHISSKIVNFSKYGTAKVIFTPALGKKLDILDFSSMRSETYPVPGGAPVVIEGNLEEDLSRRDFSINAMALDFTTDFQLIDLFRGVEDLKNKKLRILHDQSFVDDPARLLRGARMVVRYALQCEDKTKILFEEAVEKRYLATLPPQRLFSEFKKLLEEKSFFEILIFLEQQKILGQIISDYCLNLKILEMKSWQKKVLFLMSPQTEDEFAERLRLFSFNQKEILEIIKVAKA